MLVIHRLKPARGKFKRLRCQYDISQYTAIYHEQA